MRRVACLILAWTAGLASAQDADEAALLLQGSEPPRQTEARSWKLFAEGSAGREQIRATYPNAGMRPMQRLSLDLQLDAAIAPNWRAVLADRIDIGWERQWGRRSEINTLKEAYLSWQPRNNVIVDIGRINQRSGVGVGYNPTDYFRAGAVRSLVSVQPESIRNNRQGSVMLRGQMLWDDASLSLLYSPRLSRHPHSGSFNLDWGSTNYEDRVLLAFSKRIGRDFNPQWLVYHERGQSPQFGMNVTRLLNDATVGYVEWSGGRRPTALQQALGHQEDRAFRNSAVAGITYSTEQKLSVTVEYQYNEAAPRGSSWNALPAASMPAYLRYRQYTTRAQEMPTRSAWFLYATWQDVLINRLDLSAMVRRSNADRSVLSWLELRYRRVQDEFAVQWQAMSGGTHSEYGLAPQKRAWQLLYRYYF
ncbi:hypothetical protein [Alcaligenes sp. SDU_A2]|uniref:hypothetical protein n=1 Tax=Alcaligenes sp. SDU_A2 TaxID=3136634 RepID=UPI00311FE01F